MKYFFAILLPVMLLVVFGSGCRSSHKISTAIQKQKDTAALSAEDAAKRYVDSVKKVKLAYEKVVANNINYTYFSSKTNIEYDDAKGQHYDFNTFIRMKKDSVIWISIIAALGIEGFRIKITPDSIFIIDKVARTFQTRTLDYIRKSGEVPFDFTTLQNLIVGNNIYLDTTVVQYNDKGEHILFTTAGEAFSHLFTLNKSDFRILHNKIDDIRINQNRTLTIANLDYLPVGNFMFPSERTITITDKKLINVQLKYKQVDFNQTLNFPFSIPRNYKRK